MPIRKQKINIQKGQSLVELILAITIFVIISSAVLFLMTGNFKGISTTNDTAVAYSVAQEGLEAVKAISRQKWFNLDCDSDGVRVALTSTQESSNSHWTFLDSSEGNSDTFNDKFTRFIKIFPLYRTSDNLISDISADNTFDPNIRKITSSVSWPSSYGGQNQSVSFSTYVSAWPNIELIDKAFEGTFESNTKKDNGIRLKRIYMSDGGTPPKYLQYADSGSYESEVFDFSVPNPAVNYIWWNYTFDSQWNGAYQTE